MTKLQGFPTAKQATDDSCWACAGRQIVNWFIGRGEAGEHRADQFGSDQKFADQYAAAARKPGYADIDIQRSAPDALIYLGFGNNIDSRPFPTPDEIREYLELGKPLLAIVGATDPGDLPNEEAQEGHWLVIVGISDDGTRIEVFDPAEGRIVNVAYHAKSYLPDAYWQNTSYVDAWQ